MLANEQVRRVGRRKEQKKTNECQRGAVSSARSEEESTQLRPHSTRPPSDIHPSLKALTLCCCCCSVCFIRRYSPHCRMTLVRYRRRPLAATPRHSNCCHTFPPTSIAHSSTRLQCSCRRDTATAHSLPRFAPAPAPHATAAVLQFSRRTAYIYTNKLLKPKMCFILNSLFFRHNAKFKASKEAEGSAWRADQRRWLGDLQIGDAFAT